MYRSLRPYLAQRLTAYGHAQRVSLTFPRAFTVTTSRNYSRSDPSGLSSDPSRDLSEQGKTVRPTARQKATIYTLHPSGTQLLIPNVPRVKDHEVPWIGESDFEQYLRPLYDLGWAIDFKSRLAEQEAPAPSKLLSAARIKTVFTLPNYSMALKFLTRVVKTGQKEKHYPNIAILKDKLPRVWITIHTDSAYRFIWDDEDPQTPVSERMYPGVTLRDLRLAALIESRYATEFLALALEAAEKVKGATVSIVDADIFYRGKLRPKTQTPDYDELVKLLREHSQSPPSHSASSAKGDADNKEKCRARAIAAVYIG
ncbi:hypothetical protein AX16_001805 [Volvariella volvacea WC 439]|nr:hypothetical protein AX16_001805 [Volvariella volvacea WC 439]